MLTATLTRLELEICSEIWGLMRHKDQNWYIIRRDWLQEALAEHHQITRSLPAIDKALAHLRKLGLLKSQTRHLREKNGKFLPRASLYKMTSKLNRMFHGLARKFAKSAGIELIRSLLRQKNEEAKAKTEEGNRRQNGSKEPERVMSREAVAPVDRGDQPRQSEERASPGEKKLLDGLRAMTERTKPADQKSKEFTSYLDELSKKYGPAN